MTIFGVEWDELALEHIESFLANADDEAYLWEAKGGGRPDARAVRKTACGFANARGGWLILGADRRDGVWSLDGIDFGQEEPRTWVDSVIRDGMSPVPHHDTAPLPTQTGTRVAVVRVEPVEEPPCITRDGVIWQRVSGRTIPVKDPSVLARLYDHGQRAWERAAEDASALLGKVLDRNTNIWIYEPSTLIVVLAIAAVVYPDGIERRLYTEAMKSRVGELFRTMLKPDRYHGFQSGPRFSVLPDGIRAQKAGQTFETRWSVTVRNTGAVAISATLHRDQDEQIQGIGILMEDVVQPAWCAAAELVTSLGGSGRAAFGLATLGRITLSHRENYRDLGESSMAGWSASVQPAGDELEYVKRQLLRNAGFEEWEPA